MATSKNTRRAGKRVRKTTEHVDRLADRDEATRVMIEAGNLDAVRQMHFTVAEDDLPIAGTPRPAACPFCGKWTDISLVLRKVTEAEGGPYTVAHVQCDNCGAEAPSACSTEEGLRDRFALVLAAAQRWNSRGGAK
jgi:hypothetical protein